MDAYVDEGNELSQAARLHRLAGCLDQLHGLAAARIFNQMARSMRSGDVSFSQIDALFRLLDHGPQRIADLARAGGLSHCAMSRLVSRLVREGLAQKRANEANRRERLISLTPAGARFLDDLRRNTAAAYAGLLTDVPPERADRLLSALEEILPHLSLPEHLRQDRPRR